MVIFGYKSRVNGPMRALVALAVGIMMVVYPASALTTVVKIIAAFMIASGVVSLVVGLRDKERGALPLMSFNALINLLLAILMFVFAPVIAKFVIYLIGFVLLAFGIVQIVAFFGARRVMPVSFGSFVLPIVVTLVGGFILFNPFAESVMTIVAGSALVLYGVSELLSSWRMKKVRDFEDSRIDEQEAQITEADDQIDEQ
jgi:uncharacterized membrane protein HdeD (DUF308 family)